MDPRGIVSFLVIARPSGVAGDEGDLEPGVGEVAHEVVDVAFEPAVAVERRHRAGGDRDAERSRHGARPSSSR